MRKTSHSNLEKDHVVIVIKVSIEVMICTKTRMCIGKHFVR